MLTAAVPACAEDAPPPCTRDGAPVSADYLQAARDIMITTKASDRMTMLVDALLPQLMEMVRNSDNTVSPEVLDEMRAALREEIVKSIPGLLDMQACLYVHHFTKDDLEAMLAFYRSPIGVKVLAEMPGIMQEGMGLGQAWGQRAGMAAMQHVLEKYRKGELKT
ncbi:MAG: DUF2059 domain-containing protein [Proteobacteria bacterium]|nr:DUF2059 domain-containing protein [Pseudomonadota bacterium]